MFTASTLEAIPLFKKDADSIHFKLTAIVDPESINPGDRFALYVKIELSEGWHIYSLYTKGVEEQSPIFFPERFNSFPLRFRPSLNNTS